MKRVVTYDVAEGNEQSYYRFFEYAQENNAKQLTESTYLFANIRSDLLFYQEIRSLFSESDTVFIIGVNGEGELSCRQVR